MPNENETSDVPEGTETPAGESDTPALESDVPGEEPETETPGESDTPGEEVPSDAPEGEPGAETPGESDTPEEDGPTGNKAKKKIGKMTLRLKTLESENERLRAAQEKPTGPSAEPKEEDYEDYAKFEDAKLDWKLDQREQIRTEEARKQSSVTEAKERREEFHKKADVVRESKKDFDEVAMSPDMLDLYANEARHVAEILEGHDKGPEIAYHLGSNPEIAVELAEMSPLMAATKIGEIGAKLSVKPKLKSVSQAPTPINPTGAKGGGELEENPDNMTHKEWLAWRKKTKKIT